MHAPFWPIDDFVVAIDCFWSFSNPQLTPNVRFAPRAALPASSHFERLPKQEPKPISRHSCRNAMPKWGSGADRMTARVRRDGRENVALAVPTGLFLAP